MENEQTAEEQKQQEAAQEAPEQEQAPSLEERCKAEICPACAVKKEADDIRLRALAEMENFKKRLQREKEEQFKYAEEDVLADLLPVLDNLELAIRYAGDDPACKNLLTGVVMTQKIFLDILAKHGLTPVGAPGEKFDPELHEAVSEDERDDMEPGLVSTLQQRGYRLKERLLRPAKVTVSKSA